MQAMEEEIEGMKGDPKWEKGYEVTELLRHLVSVKWNLASKCPFQSPIIAI